MPLATCMENDKLRGSPSLTSGVMIHHPTRYTHPLFAFPRCQVPEEIGLQVRAMLGTMCSREKSRMKLDSIEGEVKAHNLGLGQTPVVVSVLPEFPTIQKRAGLVPYPLEGHIGGAGGGASDKAVEGANIWDTRPRQCRPREDVSRVERLAMYDVQQMLLLHVRCSCESRLAAFLQGVGVWQHWSGYLVLQSLGQDQRASKKGEVKCLAALNSRLQVVSAI